MKKSYSLDGLCFALFIVMIMFLLLLMLGVAIKSKHYQYAVSGYYYDGYVIRSDGHIWDYETTEIEPNSPVYIFFDNNRTPNKVEDDFIVNIITDYEKLNL